MVKVTSNQGVSLIKIHLREKKYTNNYGPDVLDTNHPLSTDAALITHTHTLIP